MLCTCVLRICLRVLQASKVSKWGEIIGAGDDIGDLKETETSLHVCTCRRAIPSNRVDGYSPALTQLRLISYQAE